MLKPIIYKQQRDVNKSWLHTVGSAGRTFVSTRKVALYSIHCSTFAEQVPHVCGRCKRVTVYKTEGTGTAGACGLTAGLSAMLHVQLKAGAPCKRALAERAGTSDQRQAPSKTFEHVQHERQHLFTTAYAQILSLRKPKHRLLWISRILTTVSDSCYKARHVCLQPVSALVPPCLATRCTTPVDTSLGVHA